MNGPKSIGSLRYCFVTNVTAFGGGTKVDRPIPLMRRSPWYPTPTDVDQAVEGDEHLKYSEFIIIKPVSSLEVRCSLMLCGAEVVERFRDVHQPSIELRASK